MYYLTLIFNSPEKKWGIKHYFGVVTNQSIHLFNKLYAVCMSVYLQCCIVSNDSAQGFFWFIQEHLHSNHLLFFSVNSQLNRPHPPISKRNNNGQSILYKQKPSIILWIDVGRALEPGAVPCWMFSCISLIHKGTIHKSAQLQVASCCNLKKKKKSETGITF